METEAKEFAHIIRKNIEVKISAVSCTTGGMSQSKINTESCTHNVSCNPISQAMQLNAENTDFVITMGLCLGHDILFQKIIKAPFTNFVVKDRVYNNNPLLELQNNQ